MKKQLKMLSILKNEYKYKKNHKLIVISGIFSDIFADAIQIRFVK